MSQFKLEDFLLKVSQTQKKHPDWREGQILFNTLHIYYPKLSEEIRGDVWLDPYYVDTNIHYFWKWLTAK